MPGFLDGLQNILGEIGTGFAAPRLTQQMGPDWRQQLDQREFERQRARQVAEQQDAGFQAQQDAALEQQLANVALGAPQGDDAGPLPEPDLESLIGREVQGERRRRILGAARGRVRASRPMLEAQEQLNRQDLERTRQGGREELLDTRGEQAAEMLRLREELLSRRDLNPAQRAEMQARLDVWERGEAGRNARAAASRGAGGAGGSRLRGEFNREIRPYRQQQENYQRLSAAAADPSGANDVAMIFNYMKMLDPNSVVREGEFATAETAGRSIPQAVLQAYNRAISGERLTPAQRADFARSGRQQYRSSAYPAIQQIVSQYGRLGQNQGMAPEDVTGGFSLIDLPDDETPEPAAAPRRRQQSPQPSGGGETATFQGRTYRLRPGADRRLRSSWEPVQ